MHSDASSMIHRIAILSCPHEKEKVVGMHGCQTDRTPAMVLDAPGADLEADDLFLMAVIDSGYPLLTSWGRQITDMLDISSARHAGSSSLSFVCSADLVASLTCMTQVIPC